VPAVRLVSSGNGTAVGDAAKPEPALGDDGLLASVAAAAAAKKAPYAAFTAGSVVISATLALATRAAGVANENCDCESDSGGAMRGRGARSSVGVKALPTAVESLSSVDGDAAEEDVEDVDADETLTGTKVRAPMGTGEADGRFCDDDAASCRPDCDGG
jgi:hypothetical protein